jgi:hypothetical protein
MRAQGKLERPTRPGIARGPQNPIGVGRLTLIGHPEGRHHHTPVASESPRWGRAATFAASSRKVKRWRNRDLQRGRRRCRLSGYRKIELYDRDWAHCCHSQRGQRSPSGQKNQTFTTSSHCAVGAPTQREARAPAAAIALLEAVARRGLPRRGPAPVVSVEACGRRTTGRVSEPQRVR